MAKVSEGTLLDSDDDEDLQDSAVEIDDAKSSTVEQNSSTHVDLEDIFDQSDKNERQQAWKNFEKYTSNFYRVRTFSNLHFAPFLSFPQTRSKLKKFLGAYLFQLTQFLFPNFNFNDKLLAALTNPFNSFILPSIHAPIFSFGMVANLKVIKYTFYSNLAKYSFTL